MYTATLRCGTVLSYEAGSFVPEYGEEVPCRRHGYCVVDEHGRAAGPSAGARGVPRASRAGPRAQEELLDWLRGRSVTTIHTLRHHRFTLRMIVAAERDGWVAVDLEDGTVAIR